MCRRFDKPLTIPFTTAAVAHTHTVTASATQSSSASVIRKVRQPVSEGKRDGNETPVMGATGDSDESATPQHTSATQEASTDMSQHREKSRSSPPLEGDRRDRRRYDRSRDRSGSRERGRDRKRDKVRSPDRRGAKDSVGRARLQERGEARKGQNYDRKRDDSRDRYASKGRDSRDSTRDRYTSSRSNR